MDLSPHIAMMGADINSLNSIQTWANMSTATQNGSIQSSNNLGLFDRFVN